MQQRLAVASVLVLVLLAGASAFLIQQHAAGQTQSINNNPTQTQSTHTQQTTTNQTNSTTSSGGSLLTGGNPGQTGTSDDGNETEHETEGGSATNSTTFDE